MVQDQIQVSIPCFYFWDQSAELLLQKTRLEKEEEEKKHI